MKHTTAQPTTYTSWKIDSVNPTEVWTNDEHGNDVLVAEHLDPVDAAHIVHCVNRVEALTDQLEAQSIDYQDNLTEIQLLKAQVEAMERATAKDVDRMERAAIQIESLNGECNRLKAQPTTYTPGPWIVTVDEEGGTKP